MNVRSLDKNDACCVAKVEKRRQGWTDYDDDDDDDGDDDDDDDDTSLLNSLVSMRSRVYARISDVAFNTPARQIGIDCGA